MRKSFPKEQFLNVPINISLFRSLKGREECVNTSAHFINVFMKPRPSNDFFVYTDNCSIKVMGGARNVFPVICLSLTSGCVLPTCSEFSCLRARDEGALNVFGKDIHISLPSKEKAERCFCLARLGLRLIS